ncbi:MAG TPA: 4'-phosphopantetheinyl transferase superfamily protein [Pyrinomonadaceae bacterium]
MPQNHEQLWLEAPERPLLREGEAHVWRASLEPDAPALRRLWETLSADERQRADRFHFQRDREHFVAARGGLRGILGRYTGAAPQTLRFSYDGYGKPSLSGGAGAVPPRFNVSHSGGLALYAVTDGREVGVDIERVREDFAGLDIAERFFSPDEVAALSAVPAGERATAFFDCWTRKEAYIKARGLGLSHPLHLFTVSLTPGRPAALLRTDDDPQEAARWSLVELSPGEGYRAALAIEGEVSSLRCWRWP